MFPAPQVLPDLFGIVAHAVRRVGQSVLAQAGTSQTNASHGVLAELDTGSVESGAVGALVAHCCSVELTYGNASEGAWERMSDRRRFFRRRKTDYILRPAGQPSERCLRPPAVPVFGAEI